MLHRTLRPACCPAAACWDARAWPSAHLAPHPLPPAPPLRCATSLRPPQRTLENPLWGVPGCINFIDARTKWFDEAVTSAIAAGIKQVRPR